MTESTGFQLGTIGDWSLSIISFVSIVICNKALISTLGFNFATTLTSWHLLVTLCSLHITLWLKLFEHKPFDARAVMGFGILNGISIGLLNLWLGFNSVGFYQMIKLAIIPCTVLLETLFFKKDFSQKNAWLMTLGHLDISFFTLPGDLPCSYWGVCSHVECPFKEWSSQFSIPLSTETYIKGALSWIKRSWISFASL